MKNTLIAVAALAIAPSLASAQNGGGAVAGDTTGADTTYSDTTGKQPDSTMIRSDTTIYRADSTMIRSDTTVQEEEGAIYAPPSGAAAANMGLTRSQVKELQQAIRDAGCDAGPVDGVVGPLTRQGIACVRAEKDIRSNSLNDVLSALNLSFTAASDATVGAPSGGDTTVNQADSAAFPSDTVASPDTTMQSDTVTEPDTAEQPDTSRFGPDTAPYPSDTSASPPDTVRYPTDTTG